MVSNVETKSSKIRKIKNHGVYGKHAPISEPTSVEQKIESYRDLFKNQTKQGDKQFDWLIKSYSNPQNALSYLKGRLGIR